jgi:DNA-directed RNA polymerase subunit RPC12/RpoP
MLSDVTTRVDFTDNDGEDLPLTKCICDAKFPVWQEVLGVYEERPWVCPHCGAKLIFSNAIRVFKVTPDPTPEQAAEHKERLADADAHSD